MANLVAGGAVAGPTQGSVPGFQERGQNRQQLTEHGQPCQPDDASRGRPAQAVASFTRNNKAHRQTLDKLFIEATLGGVWVDGTREPRQDPRNKHLDFADPQVVKAATAARSLYMSLPEEVGACTARSITADLGWQFVKPASKPCSSAWWICTAPNWTGFCRRTRFLMVGMV